MGACKVMLAMAVLLHAEPDGKVGNIEFTVNSVTTNGGITTVTATYINRGTLPAACAGPDLLWSDRGQQRKTSPIVSKSNPLGALTPNKPVKATFRYNRTGGTKLRFYESGFKSLAKFTDVVIP